MAFRMVVGRGGAAQTKTATAQEAGKLRAFHKLYIIGNQWYNALLLRLFVRPCTPIYPRFLAPCWASPYRRPELSFPL